MKFDLSSEGDLVDTTDQLDNADFFADPIIPGQDPTENPDTTVIAALEAQWEDLQYLIQDVTKAGGMTQAFAMEAQRISPDTWKTPVKYFSIAPSQVHRSVAMESFASTMRDILKKIIQFIKDQVTRLFQFITGVKSAKITGADIAAFGAKQQKRTDLMSKSLDKSRQYLYFLEGNKAAIDAAIRNGTENRKEPLSYDAVIDGLLADSPSYTAAIGLLGGNDGLVRDIASRGDYSTMIADVALALPNMAEDIGYKIQKIRDAANEGGNVSLTSLMTLLEQIHKESQFDILRRKTTINQATVSIQSAYDKLRPSNKAISLDRLVDVVATSYDETTLNLINGSIVNTLRIVDEMNNEMANLTETFVQIERSVDNNTSALRICRQALDVVQKDIMNLNRLIALVKTFDTNINIVADQTRRLTREISDKIQELVQNATAPKNLKDNLYDYKKSLNSY